MVWLHFQGWLPLLDDGVVVRRRLPKSQTTGVHTHSEPIHLQISKRKTCATTVRPLYETISAFFFDHGLFTPPPPSPQLDALTSKKRREKKKQGERAGERRTHLRGDFFFPSTRTTHSFLLLPSPPPLRVLFPLGRLRLRGRLRSLAHLRRVVAGGSSRQACQEREKEPPSFTRRPPKEGGREGGRDSNPAIFFSLFFLFLRAKIISRNKWEGEERSGRRENRRSGAGCK